jgi:hypothetical protein
VILVRMGQNKCLDIVETVLNMADVGQDEVDAGLVVTREQHAAVDDKQPTEVLKNRHIATDFADTTQCGDAQSSCCQWSRGKHWLGHRSTAAARMSAANSSN